jgi:hypothetical protein
MKTFKSMLVIPAGVVLALVVALLTSSPVPAASLRQEVRPTSGVLAGWRLDMDGTMYLRIRSQGEQFLWFRTPADKSQTKQVEEMLIEALSVMGDPSDEQTLTVIAKHERSLDGKTAENALPIVSVTSP